jgi:DNA modification methylase/ParB-like chromosome segregation protein Spo0J
MNQSVVTWVNPATLQPNKVASSLYAVPENYETMKENIKQMGILEPLIVSGNIVVSGNLRLQIALELGFDLIPVLHTEEGNANKELRIISHAQQRVKKYSEILREYEILDAEYPVGQGCRTDLNPAKKKNADKKKALNISKAKLSLLKSIKLLARELYGESPAEYSQVWVDVDSEKASLNRILKGLKREIAIQNNKIAIPQNYEIITNDAKIFNKSCEIMDEIETGSVSCIITSPPYFQMRDYGTGKEQRGLESNMDLFIKGLVNDFKDCYRVLKEDGSLWVNFGEAILDGHYNAIPHRFVVEMIKEGWIFNDELIWVKNNPVFTQAKRSVRAHEYIFHFVKSSRYHYDVSWLSELSDNGNLVSIGTSGKISNLLSSMDFRDNIIKTNSNNMDELRKSCTERGFHLTHNAAFPVTIPLIAILTSSKVGDTILDIYSGTGTSGEAALATQRKYLGYEIKPEFIMASEVRLKPYTEEQNELIAA